MIEAANSKNVRALKMLIELGCDVNHSVAGSGRTALSHAVENCFDEGINLLLDAGADPTIKDSSGMSTLDYMSQRLSDLKQTAIRKLCYAGLMKIEPSLVANEPLPISDANISNQEVKTSKTLFGKIKAKFGGGSKHGDKNAASEPLPYGSGLFSFPSLDIPMGNGGIELEPVRVEPMTPPFDRRKMIWTDGAHGDSSSTGPPTVETNVAMKQPLKSASSSKTPKEKTGKDQLGQLLQESELGHYEELLKSNEIKNISTFTMLNERDLKDLNVATCDRFALIKAISQAKMHHT